MEGCTCKRDSMLEGWGFAEMGKVAFLVVVGVKTANPDGFEGLASNPPSTLEAGCLARRGKGGVLTLETVRREVAAHNPAVA